ncbi:leucine-rich repeat-containing protein 75A-like, partial [Hypomesus transpacificus]|uniref:leucine-rich repeat-containing protein 75A-like n=1 Tax=Hypomesus transpacificus TaxID=137520 RepID=UPI001F07787F
MGTNQTKATGSDPGNCSLLGIWRRTQSSLRRRSSGERVGRVWTPPPYQRRVSLIQEVLVTVKAGRREEATELLKTLQQDLGMQDASLDDVLQSCTSLGNLVDPITHQLILTLVRYIHCPMTEGDSLSGMEKACRQLTYHLSPHSRWRRQGLFGNKPQPSMKSSLSGPPVGGAVELSGVPLSLRDMELLSAHLKLHSPRVRSLELGFTGLTDRALLLLVPSLAALPALETLVLNGNRLTRAVLRPLTDLLADPACFPALTWMDLGNNEDIFSLPQALLKGLRRRCPAQGRLPTIQEQGEDQGEEQGEEQGEDQGEDQG